MASGFVGTVCAAKARAGKPSRPGLGVFGVLVSMVGGRRDPGEDGRRLRRVGAEPEGQVLPDSLGNAGADGPVAQSVADCPSNSGRSGFTDTTAARPRRAGWG
ncbi:hypothetical protein GCM10010299_20710 [Streptomyces tanashiensis]|nr:hypothetical protein GCM10010299_20710 [Streptomyces tanashiensis]